MFTRMKLQTAVQCKHKEQVLPTDVCSSDENLAMLDARSRGAIHQVTQLWRIESHIAHLMNLVLRKVVDSADGLHTDLNRECLLGI